MTNENEAPPHKDLKYWADVLSPLLALLISGAALILAIVTAYTQHEISEDQKEMAGKQLKIAQEQSIYVREQTAFARQQTNSSKRQINTSILLDRCQAERELLNLQRLQMHDNKQATFKVYLELVYEFGDPTGVGDRVKTEDLAEKFWIINGYIHQLTLLGENKDKGNHGVSIIQNFRDNTNPDTCNAKMKSNSWNSHFGEEIGKVVTFASKRMEELNKEIAELALPKSSSCDLLSEIPLPDI